jgi:dihydroorotase-like cyclic amidohydrolase
MSLVLGTGTAVVDVYVHPGMFGSVATEAIVTGIAAALSYLVGTTIQFSRARFVTAD